MEAIEEERAPMMTRGRMTVPVTGAIKMSPRYGAARPGVFYFAGALLIAAGLWGCAGQSEVKTSHGIEIPQQHYLADGQDLADGQVDRDIARLDDWLPDFGVQVLGDLIAEAFDNNRDLQVTAARVAEARAIARVQAGAMLPALSVGSSAARSRVNVPVSGISDPVKSLGNAYQADLSLSWELDLWGKLNNTRRAAVLEFEAREAGLAAARLSLAGRVVQAWFGLVEAESQLVLAQTTQASFEQAARMVRSRYEKGLRRGLDVRLSASNAASARALSAARREQVRRASTALEILLGRYPGGAMSADGAQLPALEPKSFDALPSDLLARRPDLASAEASAAAAELQHFAAKKDMLPSLRLSASGGYQGGEPEVLGNPANLIWSLAGGLVQPLFQGGALKARAEAAGARGDQALARYAQTLLNAFQEVETTLFAEETLSVRESALGQAAHEAIEAETLASDLYARGLTGIFELLEAQRRSLNAQSSWLDVKRQRLANRVTLYLALGGGVPEREITSAALSVDALTEPSLVNFVPPIN